MTGHLLWVDVSSWLVVEVPVAAVVNGLQFPADDTVVSGAAVCVSDASVVSPPGSTLHNDIID